MNDTVPKLSVLLVTYNHEAFIRQAVDSVLMQQTDFEFEIIVADDHSTDATVAIIAEYQAEHQNIRILGSKQNVGITRNYQRGFAACRGEYVAILEGDDFWISPNKLSAMATFLDEHPQCSLCFHRLIRLEEESDQALSYPPINMTTSSVLSAAQLATENFIGNFSTCVYRRKVVERLDPALFEMKVYDWMFNIAVAQHGLIGYVPEVMSVYRAHASSIWSAKQEAEHKLELFELIDEYNSYLGFKYDEEFQACKTAFIERTEVPEPVVVEPPKPRMSVLLVTYNQEKYVREALESVLMQKTSFIFEVIVADD